VNVVLAETLTVVVATPLELVIPVINEVKKTLFYREE